MIGLFTTYRKTSLALTCALAFVATACGPSQADMDAQIDKYNKLAQENQAEKSAHAETSDELAKTKEKIKSLHAELKRMGVDLEKTGIDLQKAGSEKEQLAQNMKELEAALDEYKKRAAQLERIKARFEALRTKLKKLTDLGLKVEIRHNRMVIRLPGDVLYASGSTKLQEKGLEVVAAVADVIRKDSQLKARYFQIAGHTDNVPVKGGKYGDNWGLSAMRAREVLIYLVAPTGDGKNPGGGLDSRLLHAAGYGDSDPVAPNDAAEGREQNRRVELVLMPDVEEMISLKDM
jgi:chemotaxis protein MotB